MKRIISCLLLATLVLASFIAMIPASAAAPTEFNVMGDSNADKQFAGEGNVFYFDYHQFKALGNDFPMDNSQKGNADYMIRFPNNGSGSASVTDGVKNTSGFNHTPDSSEPARAIGDKNYNQIFGYSFKESVVVDKITIYLPSDTPISAIDVYGASVVGATYAKDADKTPLASFAGVQETATTDIEGTSVIVLDATLFEALKIDYIIFGVICTTSYKLYEVELNGIMATDAADFSALKAQYARYKDLNEDDWTEETWAALETALATTDPVNQNATSTAAEISSAATTLKTALDNLKAKPVDKTALAAKIAEAKALNEDDYTSASWEIFKSVLAAAETTFNTDGMSKTEVESAVAALNDAIAALVVPGDKTDLVAEIAKVADLDENDYTPATWEALQAPFAKAIAVRDNADATQDEVDAALAALTMAINDLAFPGNKDNLSAAIAAAKALNKADYNTTAVTWNVFEQCIEDAEAVVADKNATQAEVDMALEALNEKVKGLGSPVTNEDDDDVTTDDDDADVDEDEDEDATDATTPATQAPATQAPVVIDTDNKKGGCGSSVALSALAIVGALGTAVVIKKRD